MNDEFVSHNKSSGGWDMQNKWVSMLQERGCKADPRERRVGGCFVSQLKSYIVFDEMKCMEFYLG